MDGLPFMEPFVVSQFIVRVKRHKGKEALESRGSGPTEPSIGFRRRKKKKQGQSQSILTDFKKSR